MPLGSLVSCVKGQRPGWQQDWQGMLPGAQDHADLKTLAFTEYASSLLEGTGAWF